MKLRKPQFWDKKKISLFSILLFPFSIIYLSLLWIKKIQLTSITTKNNFPIICVGNIYIGGTGKTPLSAEIFKILKSMEKKPSFIKKHYNYLFDEIKMLNEIGDTFTAKSRKVAINLSRLNGNNVFILDDGFQDFTIKSDLSILCFNSKQLIGNGFTIPSGPLRERLNAVSRADCIFINGEKTQETLEFEKKILKKSGSKKLHVFYSKYNIKNVEFLKDKKITAFAGIGNPSNFFELLRENKLNVKKTYSFPDHHNYTDQELDEISDDKSTIIVTTKKDYYRLKDEQKKICSYIDINLEIEKRNKFETLIKSYL